MKDNVPPATDTIVAIATPPGRGGVGIVRASGPAVRAIATTLFGRVPSPRRAEFKHFADSRGAELDSGLALFFPAPHSFTGEDVLELHAHGGPVVLALLLTRVCELGARLARPGEFSQRAFLNDKLDLVQAEAIADLIDSGSEQAARAALRSLRGEFSARVLALVEALIALRSYVEAALDFPDEELDFLSDGKVAERLRDICARLDVLLGAANRGSLLREGLTVAIAGRPNAGKSSLLNRLAGYDAAIVTEIPGTTRDLLREHIHLDGLPLHVIDTAGLRESGDAVEQEGVRRAWEAIASADRVLLVVDDTQGLTAEDQRILEQLPAKLPVTVICNKIDLSGRPPQCADQGRPAQLALSARTGAGLDLLRAHLKHTVGFESVGEDGFLARRRHVDALERAHHHLQLAGQRFTERTGELLAEELRLAQQTLGEITGEFSSEDLLGRIFSSFCIGK
ncbi:MAG: tRNA uridine-5-carboxymethylaminomethyl(34) synthesis GTPase MnmE [Gammaproteobacteria bacterium]|nr:tRNA uridine-5-carboxymethylaminomethyl(34) synthesis GTPase MnmE [Gammaproteobacteria bacterium]MDE2023281.1 tRNA uridine-5-carboxymethylaminomethyl(34) synthesis GTPase MnmE [Gammaproteobacteria bacterium]